MLRTALFDCAVFGVREKKKNLPRINLQVSDLVPLQVKSNNAVHAKIEFHCSRYYMILLVTIVPSMPTTHMTSMSASFQNIHFQRH